MLSRLAGLPAQARAQLNRVLDQLRADIRDSEPLVGPDVEAERRGGAAVVELKEIGEGDKELREMIALLEKRLNKTREKIHAVQLLMLAASSIHYYFFYHRLVQRLKESYTYLAEQTIDRVVAEGKAEALRESKAYESDLANYNNAQNQYDEEVDSNYEKALEAYDKQVEGCYADYNRFMYGPKTVEIEEAFSNTTVSFRGRLLNCSFPICEGEHSIEEFAGSDDIVRMGLIDVEPTCVRMLSAYDEALTSQWGDYRTYENESYYFDENQFLADYRGSNLSYCQFIFTLRDTNVTDRLAFDAELYNETSGDIAYTTYYMQSSNVSSALQPCCSLMDQYLASLPNGTIPVPTCPNDTYPIFPEVPEDPAEPQLPPYPVKPANFSLQDWVAKHFTQPTYPTWKEVTYKVISLIPGVITVADTAYFLCQQKGIASSLYGLFAKPTLNRPESAQLQRVMRAQGLSGDDINDLPQALSRLQRRAGQR